MTDTPTAFLRIELSEGASQEVDWHARRFRVRRAEVVAWIVTGALKGGVEVVDGLVAIGGGPDDDPEPPDLTA
jgi:hypothetical protein